MALELLNSVYRLLNNYPEQIITIAYSGGVDSQVLLHAVMQLKAQGKLTNSIKLCHIHHGLSANADSWQEFAKTQADKYQIEFLTENVKVVKGSRQSLEAQARDARYQALVAMTSPKDIILTGHHSDDQAETFFLALKRGSGLAGLSGMQQVSEFFGRKLIRPLLTSSRSDIERYAKEHHLTWIEDESNQDTSYERNFLRHEVLPVLKARWPSFLTTLARSVQHCQESDALLAEIAEQDLASCLIDQECLAIDKLQALSTLRINQVLRSFIKIHHGLMPSTQQLKQVISQLNAAEDKVPTVKVGDYWFRRYQNNFYLTPNYADLSTWLYQNTLTELPTSLELPDNLGKLIFELMTYEALSNKPQDVKQKLNHYYLAVAPQDSLTIQFIHNNPVCLPSYRQHSRNLKKVLQELGVAPWLRKRIPFIFINGQLALVGGYFVCQPFIAKAGQTAIKITWQQ